MAVFNIGQKKHFFEKKTPKISPPLFNLFCVLHQNKSLHNFHKRGQRSIIESKKGPDQGLQIDLEYIFWIHPVYSPKELKVFEIILIF